MYAFVSLKDLQYKTGYNEGERETKKRYALAITSRLATTVADGGVHDGIVLAVHLHVESLVSNILRISKTEITTEERERIRNHKGY